MREEANWTIWDTPPFNNIQERKGIKAIAIAAIDSIELYRSARPSEEKRVKDKPSPQISFLRKAQIALRRKFTTT
jgi:hypothetical protein